MPKNKILIVDDDYISRELLNEILNKEGYSTTLAESGQMALDILKKQTFDLIITDLKMDGIDGIQVLKEALKLKEPPEIIVVTGYSSVETAVEVLRSGAYDYITKPLDVNRTKITVKKAIEKHYLKKEVFSLKKKLKTSSSTPEIISVSKKMTDILQLIQLVSPSDSNVILRGESGTGKEVVSRKIHNDSHRSEYPFIAINCGALPETLLESELFGHEAGAFSGALKRKNGLIHDAHNGTLLLDEIGDMPLSIQVKLLRVLEDREVRRLGSNTIEKVDIRLISATNKNLEKMIDDGEFREDLYYRLRVVPITLPPLRDRKEDILPLVNLFILKNNKKLKKHILGFNDEATNIILSYNWPGNIRELQNIVEGASILCQNEYITEDELYMLMRIKSGPAKIKESYSQDLNLKNMIEKIESEYIEEALNKTHGNQLKAAELLGIGRSTLIRKLDTYKTKSL